MGVAASIVNEAYPPETKFTPENIPDMTGKVIIVTGANAGKPSPSSVYIQRSW